METPVAAVQTGSDFRVGSTVAISYPSKQISVRVRIAELKSTVLWGLGISAHGQGSVKSRV